MSGVRGRQEYEVTCRDCDFSVKGDFSEVFPLANSHAEEYIGHEVKVTGPIYYAEWKW